MGLRLARKSVTLSAREGSAFSAVFCLAQPKRKRIRRGVYSEHSRRAPQNDTVTDRPGLEVSGFSLVRAILPRRGMFGIDCSCTVLGLLL